MTVAEVREHCEKHNVPFHVLFRRINRLRWSLEKSLSVHFTKPNNVKATQARMRRTKAVNSSKVESK